MVGISLGSILSNVTGGWLTEELGPTTPARVAGLASCLLLVALPRVIPALPDGAAHSGREGHAP